MIERPMRNTRAAALGAVVALTLTACGPADAAPREMSAAQWRQDLAWLADKLPDKHGDAFHQLSRAEFEAAVASLDRRIPELERHEVLAELGRIVALVGDGHTELWLPQQATGFRRLPVAVGYYGDELYVFAATPENTGLLGRRLTAIGGVPVAEAYERVVPLIARDNEYEYRRSAPVYLMFPAILDAVGLAASPEEAVLTLAGPEGEADVTLGVLGGESPEWITARKAAGSEPPLYLTRPDRWYWYEYLQDSRTVYLQYDRCRDQPKEASIKKFARELFDFVDSHPVDRFVVDLRHNTGGNFHRNEPLIEGIRERPEINQAGRLFVITSRTTFSAATIAAIDLKRETAALVVGEPSRGKPNGYSDEKHLRLPNSNVEVNYAPLYRERAPEMGDAPYLPVDLAVEPAFEDYRDGRDPVLAAVLAYDRGQEGD